MSLSRWKPPNQRTPEDQLLFQYWQVVGGIVYAEVVIGGHGLRGHHPDGSHVRRIDAIRFELPSADAVSDIVLFVRASAGEFEQNLAHAARTEVIEIKQRLGRYVFGQVIAGADLMEMEYRLGNINQVILCEIGDPLMEKICAKHGILVRHLNCPIAPRS